jgi:drug/metabolite transporter (DMT)-like permease
MRGRAGLGLGLAVLSAATFGTSGTFASGLLASGWSPGAAVLVRIAVAAAVLTVPAVVQLQGRWPALRRRAWSVAAYGIVAVGVAQLCYFNAVEHVSVAVALLLEYSGVLLVVAWMWARHGRRPGPLTTAGGLLAVVGLVLVLDLTGHQHVDGVGVLWGLGAATGLAAYFILSAETDDGPALPATAMAWGGMVVAAVTLAVLGAVHAMPMHASTRPADFHGHHVSWILPVLGMSVVAAVIAYSTGIGAARLLGARLASFVGLAEVLAATLFAWLLLAQRPTLLQGIGGVVVLAGIALVRAAEREPAAEPLPDAPDPLPA